MAKIKAEEQSAGAGEEDTVVKLKGARFYNRFLPFSLSNSKTAVSSVFPN